MASWLKMSLRSIAHPTRRWAINGGPFGSKLTSRDYVSNGVPVIRGCNLSGPGKFSSDGFVFVSEEKADELLANNAHPGDLVFTQRGTLGQVGVIPSDSKFKRFVISQSQMKLTVDPTRVDVLFAYYFFSHPETVRSIENRAMAAGVPHINLEILREFEMPVPPLDVQSRIARILCAYDDLIENCERRIRVLDEMARALYREWFVSFRYPGHENVPLVESATGRIPKGWEVRPLVRIARITMGQSPKSEFYNRDGEGLPFHQGVTDFGSRFPVDRVFCTAEARTAEEGDILFSVRAPVGRMNIASRRMALGRGVSAIRHIAGNQAFLWEQLRARFTHEDMIGNGAIFAAVTKKEMEEVELLVPPEELAWQVAGRLEPIHSAIGALDQSMRNLRKTRDLLLPRLLSGQLSVAEAA